MIIDAKDFLHSGRVHGCCHYYLEIVISRNLPRAFESSGEWSTGFCETKDTEPFVVSACDKFIYTEILRPAKTMQVVPDSRMVPPLEEII